MRTLDTSAGTGDQTRERLAMAPCPDCGEELTCAEVTAPDGSRFITVHDADMAVLMYRPEHGYSVRTVTGRQCGQPANHW